MDDTTKACSKCRASLPLSAFSPRADRPGTYRSACRACRTAESNEWARTHRANKIASKARWESLNREAESARHRRWYQNNADLKKDRVNARRSVELSAFVEAVKSAEVYRRDGYVCQICREPLDMDAVFPRPLSPSVDHVIPLARGGTHEYANVQAAQLRCNLRKGTRAAPLSL